MKTIIEINGIPVEFTDQKPDKPCACWRVKRVGNVTYGPELAWIEYGLQTGRLIDNGTNRTPYIDDLYNAGWRFSAPLVPVTEVEKAWFEGHSTATRNYIAEENIDPEVAQEQADQWNESLARKVVEGLP